MAANYYKNEKTYSQEVPLGVSGTVKLHPGYYVKGESFAGLPSGMLTDKGSETPAEVTANSALLIYTETDMAPVFNIVGGTGITVVEDPAGTFTISLT